MAKKKKIWTYGDVLAKLETIATAKRLNNEIIKGNKKLELVRAKEVKIIEDMLAEWVEKTFKGATFIRSYKHLYPKKKRNKK
jgi:hypothetical protein